MKTFEGQLAVIAAASGIRQFPSGTTSDWAAASTAFPVYPIPPADYVVYDHSPDILQNIFHDYETVSNLILRRLETHSLSAKSLV
jgi:hypothetical protein